jgi:multiple sugar transport system substrate-binding protein
MRRLRVAAAVAVVLGMAGAAPARELRVWAMGREGEVLRDLVPEFERRHPGATVRVQQIPWSAAHEKLLTASVGDALPDVFQIGNTWIPEIALLEAAQSADAELPAMRADVFPGIADTNVVDGRAWAVPWYADTRLLFYRADLAAAAGVVEAPPTWSAWMDALLRVQARQGAGEAAILAPLTEWQLPVILALQRGATLLADDATRGAFASEPARGAFAFYLELFRRGVARRDAGTQVTNVYQDFAGGRFAFYVTGPWNLTEFATRLPAGLADAWRTAPMPAPEPGTAGVSLAGGASLAVARRTSDPVLAWDLVRYLTEPATECRLYALAGDLPARRSAWDACGIATGDPHAAAFRTQLQHVVPTPQIPEWERIATRVAHHLETAVRGDATLDDALAALDHDVDAILAKRRWLRERGA